VSLTSNFASETAHAVDDVQEPTRIQQDSDETRSHLLSTGGTPSSCRPPPTGVAVCGENYSSGPADSGGPGLGSDGSHADQVP